MPRAPLQRPAHNPKAAPGWRGRMDAAGAWRPKVPSARIEGAERPPRPSSRRARCSRQTRRPNPRAGPPSPRRPRASAARATASAAPRRRSPARTCGTGSRTAFAVRQAPTTPPAERASRRTLRLVAGRHEQRLVGAERTSNLLATARVRAPRAHDARMRRAALSPPGGNGPKSGCRSCAASWTTRRPAVQPAVQGSAPNCPCAGRGAAHMPAPRAAARATASASASISCAARRRSSACARRTRASTLNLLVSKDPPHPQQTKRGPCGATSHRSAPPGAPRPQPRQRPQPAQWPRRRRARRHRSPSTLVNPELGPGAPSMAHPRPPSGRWNGSFKARSFDVLGTGHSKHHLSISGQRGKASLNKVVQCLGNEEKRPLIAPFEALSETRKSIPKHSPFRHGLRIRRRGTPRHGPFKEWHFGIQETRKKRHKPFQALSFDISETRNDVPGTGPSKHGILTFRKRQKRPGTSCTEHGLSTPRRRRKASPERAVPSTVSRCLGNGERHLWNGAFQEWSFE